MAREVAVPRVDAEALMAAAAGIAREEGQCLQFGMSGERLVGEEVARHLEAALALMRASGSPCPTMPQALDETKWSGVGDVDSRHAARAVVELLIRAQTGAVYADYEAWNLRPGRGLEEVAGLMLLAAVFARRYLGRGV